MTPEADEHAGPPQPAVLLVGGAALASARADLERRRFTVIVKSTTADAGALLASPPEGLAAVVVDDGLPDGASVELLELVGARAPWCARVLYAPARADEPDKKVRSVCDRVLTKRATAHNVVVAVYRLLYG